MQKKWRTILGLAFSASLMLSGCGSFTQSPGGSGLSDNQVLRITELDNPPTLDSAKTADYISSNILNNIQEGLYRLGRNKQPEPGVASDYQISPDKKTYTFNLRNDATWSDGVPVKAQDFEFAWKRALDPKTKSEYAYILYPIVNAEEFNKGKTLKNGNKATANDVGVKAINDHTLVVKLKKPMLNFLNLVTLANYYPQRKDIVEKYKDQYALKPDTMVYDGPFKLNSWSVNELDLVKNDQYWDKNSVSLTKVVINVIKDTATAINLYNANKIDVASINSSFVDIYSQTPDYVKVDTAGSFYIMMNQNGNNKSFFQNEKIRKAISLAIDREELVKILKDGSKPAGSLIPPAINGEGIKSFRDDKDGEIVKTDLQQARKLFNDGVKELPRQRVPELQMILSNNSTMQDIAVNIKEQLRQNIGLEVKLNPLPFKQRLARQASGKFDLAISGWLADYNDPFNFLEVWKTGNSQNFSKVSIPEYDQLVERASLQTDPKKQIQLYKQAEKILVGTDGDGQTALVPLYYSTKSYIQKTKVKDLYRHPVGAQYSLKWAYIAKDNQKN